MHCKRMHAACQFLRQQLVYNAVPGQQIPALKCTADGDDLEVGLGAIGYIVHVSFVEYLEMQRGQAVCQLLFDSRLGVHELLMTVVSGVTMGFPASKINLLLLRN